MTRRGGAPGGVPLSRIFSPAPAFRMWGLDGRGRACRGSAPCTRGGTLGKLSGCRNAARRVHDFTGIAVRRAAAIPAATAAAPPPRARLDLCRNHERGGGFHGRIDGRRARCCEDGGVLGRAEDGMAGGGGGRVRARGASPRVLRGAARPRPNRRREHVLHRMVALRASPQAGPHPVAAVRRGRVRGRARGFPVPPQAG